jgi:hypothetical protein
LFLVGVNQEHDMHEAADHRNARNEVIDIIAGGLLDLLVDQRAGRARADATRRRSTSRRNAHRGGRRAA